ncbi:hypothetical protein [Tissierella praeacuta]|uniref:hypothetical protein n=1 Tax=Tissierella praeacuta TaxID=43131 RepID=UPI0033413EC2
MILDFIRDNLDGDTWEKWCDDCYRDRYQSDNFTKIPASHSGDVGIEGFTMSGVVYQCYCPEKHYTDNELYEHLRIKVTNDIGKLICKDNAKRISNLGIHNVKEWHFVVPEYKDKRIIEHLEKKRLEVLEAKAEDSTTFSYIDDDIRLVIKTAEDFKVELVRLIRNPLVDIKLNAAVKSIEDVDWASCDTDKIDNIKRKLKAIMGPDEDDDFEDMLKYWAEAYLKGIEIMNELQISCGSIYEELFELEQQYKSDVSAKSKMNRDKSLNNTLFNEIIDNFEETLKNEFTCFSIATIKELKRDLVSGWLADCSLQFKAGV